jgi:hypothetical protein
MWWINFSIGKKTRKCEREPFGAIPSYYFSIMAGLGKSGEEPNRFRSSNNRNMERENHQVKLAIHVAWSTFFHIAFDLKDPFLGALEVEDN